MYEVNLKNANILINNIQLKLSKLNYTQGQSDYVKFAASDNDIEVITKSLNKKAKSYDSCITDFEDLLDLQFHIKLKVSEQNKLSGIDELLNELAKMKATRLGLINAINTVSPKYGMTIESYILTQNEIANNVLRFLNTRNELTDLSRLHIELSPVDKDRADALNQKLLLVDKRIAEIRDKTMVTNVSLTIQIDEKYNNVIERFALL